MAQAGGRATLPYVAAFDGLRALAVLAVVAYHASLAGMPGGFFGVDVFFVISGYLVTALLFVRAAAGGGIIPDARGALDFWGRRLTRLVPAAVVMVALTWLAFAVLDMRRPGVLTAEALTALSYTANWFFLFNDQSYFDTIATPSPFLHFWSLAVEAQFYLLWPVLLIATLRFGGRLMAFALAVSLAAISTLVVASLYSPETDPSRAYYGTDARVAGLLLGAALAIVVRPSLAARAPRFSVEIAGWGGLAVLLWLTTSVSEYDPFIYRGGFFIASTAALAVLIASLHGANTVAWILSRSPLRWLGKRAYSIYLWHWPIFVLTQPQMAADLQSLSLLVARLGATLILADLSYRFVESQFRHNIQTRRLPRIEFGTGPILQRPWARPVGVLSVGLIAIIAAGGLPLRSGVVSDAAQYSAAQSITAGSVESDTPASTYLASDRGATEDLATRQLVDMLDRDGQWVGRSEAVQTAVSDALPSAASAASAAAGPSASTTLTSDSPTASTSTGMTDSPMEAAEERQRDPAGVAREPQSVNPPPATVGTSQPARGSTSPGRSTTTMPPSIDPALSSAVASSGSVASPRVERTEVSPAGAPDPAALGASVTIIGDSITLGAADALLRAMPGAVVDAEVGRQFWSTPAVITELTESETLGDVVVLHLGSNGPFTSQQYDMIMDLLGERTVVWVSITVPRRWEADVNESLAVRTAGREGVSMADWHAFSHGTAEFFISDGVHLTPAGQHAYASLIAEAVAVAIASRG